MREVVLKLTSQKDLVKHQSEARTFGELKKEMRQIKWSGMRVVERASKSTLQMDDAVLPQGDFLLFLVPEKVKSGKKSSGGADTLSGPIEDCKYNELRSHMSWLNRNKDANLDMSGGTPELQKELKKYYKKNPGTEIGTSATKQVAPKKEKAAKVAQYKPTPREDDEDDEDYEERLAFEKKAFDKKRKKAAEKAEELRLAAEKAAEEKAAAEKKAADQKKAPKKKKGFFAKKEKAVPEAETPSDPIEAIEDSRQRMNKAIDEIVLQAIEGGPATNQVLQYTVDDLDKELKEIRRALKTSRSNAVYID